MKKILVACFTILLVCAAIQAHADSYGGAYGGGGGGSSSPSTVLDADADGAADAANLAYYMKSVATTGKISITGPAAGSTRAKTFRDADDTILELGGSYTPSGTWDWSSATVTWPTNLATFNGIAPSADMQTLLAAADYAAMRTALGLVIGTNVQAYNQYYMKKSSAAFTEGFLVKTDANGDLVSAGEPVDLSSTISKNVETSGFVSGRMRAVIVAVPSGVHDGSDDAVLMTDGGIDIGTDALIGMTVYNITDGSSCTITDNAATTITCTLAGGTDNNWDANDVWQVGPGPAQSGSVFYVGSAGVIRHPATAGYLAGYYATVAAVVTIDVAATMQIATLTNAAGDSIDSEGAAENFIRLHNVSATSARQHGKSGTWTDGD